MLGHVHLLLKQPFSAGSCSFVTQTAFLCWVMFICYSNSLFVLGHVHLLLKQPFCAGSCSFVTQTAFLCWVMFICYSNSLFVLGHVHRFDIFAAPEVGGSPGRSWEEGRALGEARGEGGRALRADRKPWDIPCEDGFVLKCCVPLNPMVLLIIIPIKWLFHWEYTLFSDKPRCGYHENLMGLKQEV